MKMIGNRKRRVKRLVSMVSKSKLNGSLIYMVEAFRESK